LCGGGGGEKEYNYQFGERKEAFFFSALQSDMEERLTRGPFFQINQPTRCKNFSSLLLDVYVRRNMFRASSRPSSGAQQLQKQPLVLPLERGGNSAVGRDRAGCAGPTTTNSTAITTLQR